MDGSADSLIVDSGNATDKHCIITDKMFQDGMKKGKPWTLRKLVRSEIQIKTFKKYLSV